MKTISLAHMVLLCVICVSCGDSGRNSNWELGYSFSEEGLVPPDPDADGTGAFGISPIADKFEYPLRAGVGAKLVGDSNKSAPQEGDWYYSNGFGSYCANCGGFSGYHPGEDWNLKCAIVGDTKCDLGQPVYAVANGTVIKAWDLTQGLRYGVVIKHLLPSDEDLAAYILPGTRFPSGVGPKFRSVFSGYLHMQEVYVKDGQQVNVGDLIGRIGDANGPHLHFEMRYTSRVNFPAYLQSPQALTDRGMLSPSKFIEAHRYISCDGANVQPCSQCGMQTRTCNRGIWSAWSECLNTCSGPTVSIAPSTAMRGQTFIASGTGFPAYSSVSAYVRRPDGSVWTAPYFSANSNGNYTMPINTSIYTQIGKHAYWATDWSSNLKSNEAIFYVEGLSGSQTYATISISPLSGPRGTKFSIIGSGFSSYASLAVRITRPDKSVNELWGSADYQGNFFFDLQSDSSTQIGQFDTVIVDPASGRQSNHVTFQVVL